MGILGIIKNFHLVPNNYSIKSILLVTGDFSLDSEVICSVIDEDLNCYSCFKNDLISKEKNSVQSKFSSLFVKILVFRFYETVVMNEFCLPRVIVYSWFSSKTVLVYSNFV